MEDLRLYSKYLVLAVAIFGTIRYSDIRDTKAKYFLFAIWYIVFTEFLASNFYKLFGLYNYPVYALFTFLQITFYLWWFRSLLESEKRQKIVVYFIYVYILFCIINAIFIQDVLIESSTYAFAVGLIFLVVTICYYYIEIFKSDLVLRIRSSIYFWFSLGVLLFHATFMPFYFANKFFLFGDVKLLSIVSFFLCFIMYTCFMIGFIVAKKSAKQHPLN